MVDSDCAGFGDTQDEQLVSPVIDASSCDQVELEFSNQFRSYSGSEIADLDVSTDGGALWTNVLRMQGSSVGYPTPVTTRVDISSQAANQLFQFRFNYYNAHNDWWWAVDNLQIHCLTPMANLSISKSDSPDPSLLGYPLTYTLNVVNNGPDEASSVTLSDTLPDSLNFSKATSSQGGGCIEDAGVVTCELGTLSSTTTATVTLVVTPTLAGTITNTASVTTTTTDPNTENNRTVETTSVILVADLAVVKSDSPDPVLVGRPLTYTLTITNYGPADATDVALTDTLPATVTFDSAAPSQSVCSPPVSGVIICDLGAIDSAANATVSIVVTPSTEGTIGNTVSVAGIEFDPVITNNEATESTVVETSQYQLFLPLVTKQASQSHHAPYSWGGIAVL